METGNNNAINIHKVNVKAVNIYYSGEHEKVILLKYEEKLEVGICGSAPNIYISHFTVMM